MELAVILALRGPVKFSEEHATTTKQWDKIWITKKMIFRKIALFTLKFNTFLEIILDVDQIMGRARNKRFSKKCSSSSNAKINI